MAVIKKNLKDLPIASDNGSLLSLKKSSEISKLRDSYMFFDFNDTENKYQIGYGIIYPNSRTGGDYIHVHNDSEEIYHIIDGFGEMVIGKDRFEIQPGDTFIVPKFKEHYTINNRNTPIKMFWVVVKEKN